MKIFCTTDNNCGKYSSETYSAQNSSKSEISEKDAIIQSFSDLSNIANIPISELAEQNPALVIFPYSFKENNDGIENQSVFNMSGSESKIENAKLTTGNIMGFVGINDTQLEITSRFTKTQSEKTEDYFLHYMLEKVYALNLFDLKYSSGIGQFDFLIFMFPYFLKKALAQGMFKTYQFFKLNDSNIKGAVDVNRHIKENTPFFGKISYNTRMRSFDNDITELVRHTIEAIKLKDFGKSILTKNEEARRNVESIVLATPSYNLQAQKRIIERNAKRLNHPYFTAWRPLQKICLAILNHKKLKYGQNTDKIYGVLFDGAWLWEEYLATLLYKLDFTHAQNKTRKNGISLWKSNPRYPDFYKGKQSETFTYGTLIPDENYILDAKYKPLDKNGIRRDDAHQIVTYMHILPAKRAGLVYPYQACDSDFSKVQKEFNIFGMGGTIKTYGLRIPQNASSVKDFAKQMKLSEDELLGAI